MRQHYNQLLPKSQYFNPRTPLQSATPSTFGPSHKPAEFQSTHSITECDGTIGRPVRILLYFNPRTPLQSATNANLYPHVLHSISIHALHYRVRRRNISLSMVKEKFQSTHSITECDCKIVFCSLVGWVFQSTHSITECDPVQF